jgi:energy-coupling factor transport system permease protein
MAESGEFELLGRIAIGQYLPTGSPIHRLDPRFKLLMGLLLIVGTVGAGSVTGLAVLLLVLLAALHLARVALRFALAGLLPVLPFLLLLAVLQAVAIPQYGVGSTVLWHWSIVTVTTRSLLASALLIARFCAIVLGLSLFSFTTTVTEMTHGIEHLLLPFQRVGLPAHELALVAIIAIRFLPTIAEEGERLMKAQASRGADFGAGRRNFVRRARRLLPLLVPLFLAALERAEMLIEAMEARCYMGGKGRTHLVHMRARPVDWIALLITAALCGLVLSRSGIDTDAAIWHLLLSRL